MILVDTSVWVDHLRRDNPALRRLLDDATVAGHSFVIGELACDTLRNRDVILEMLADLACTPVAGDAEVLALIASQGLMGRGLGWVDVHLLASALLGGAELWTRDRPLDDAARRCGIRYDASRDS